jgi:N-acyl-D-aspartate/D-glutamate deacylase
VVALLVNGTFAVREGRPTGALAGKVLRPEKTER